MNQTDQTDQAKRTLSGRKSDPGFEWGALKSLSHYLWPAGQPDMKLRVSVALALLAIAKLANVYVPVLYKEVVDALFPAPAEPESDAANK